VTRVSGTGKFSNTESMDPYRLCAAKSRAISESTEVYKAVLK